MSKLTAIVTAVALLVHILAGCCLHHAHAEPVEQQLALESACCDHGAHGAGGQEDGDAPEPEPCDQDSCVVVASDPLHIPSLMDGIAVWSLPSLSPTIGDHRADFSQLFGCLLRPHRTLFDLHQILLI